MTQTNHLTTKSIHSGSLTKRMFTAAGIGLALIAIFLMGVHDPNPAWGKLWMLKPLIVVPLACSLAGVFYYFMDHMRSEGGWKQIAANALSLLAFIFILWIGTVLGLNGTLWN